MLFNSIPQSPNKVSDETLDLFKKVLQTDLRSYGLKIARERGLDEQSVLELIPSVLNINIMEKINQQYLDTTSMRYKKELNKYSVADLKEIARRNELKMTGTRDELILRIADKLGLIEFSQEELDKSKSFKSKPLKSRRKLKGNVDLSETPNHYVSDSD